MELYISGKEADLSEWETVIKDYENERAKCRDFNPWKNIITRFGGFCSSNNTMMEEESDYDNDLLHPIEEYLFINYLNIS